MFYSRKSPRMKTFDYSTPTSYFITICTHEKVCLFGKADMLNEYGQIAERAIHDIPKHYSCVTIEKHVIMPNHVHILMLLSGEACPAISTIVGSYKAEVSRQIHQYQPERTVWQRSFHDHVIRNEKSWQKIWQYIDENPAKWEMDCFYDG